MLNQYLAVLLLFLILLITSGLYYTIGVQSARKRNPKAGLSAKMLAVGISLGCFSAVLVIPSSARLLAVVFISLWLVMAWIGFELGFRAGR